MTEPRRCPRNAAANTIETNDADANAMERLAALISRVSCALIHVAQILEELSNLSATRWGGVHLTNWISEVMDAILRTTLQCRRCRKT